MPSVSFKGFATTAGATLCEFDQEAGWELVHVEAFASNLYEEPSIIAGPILQLGTGAGGTGRGAWQMRLPGMLRPDGNGWYASWSGRISLYLSGGVILGNNANPATSDTIQVSLTLSCEDPGS